VALPALGRETKAAATARPPWGFWASLLWGTTGYALIVTTFLGVGFARVALASRDGGDVDALIRAVFESGDTITLSYVLSFPIVLAVILAAIGARHGPKVADYLGLTPISLVKFSPWILAVAAIELLIVPGASRALGVPIVPEFLQAAYPTTRWTPLLWIAVVGLAPLVEETLYRGFVLRGWARSQLGPVGALVLLSALWAATHLQYGPFEQAMVFVYGLLLGAARLSTGSLYVPIAMHMMVNAIVLARASLLA